MTHFHDFIENNGGQSFGNEVLS